MNETAGEFGRWIGGSETHADVVTVVPARAFAALLDHPESYSMGMALPAPAHWLYFLPTARQSELGTDGHPQRGGFLPPITLPRRMWAGSRIQFHRALRIGDLITRTSRIADVSAKQGRSGSLAFVRVQHEISTHEGLAISEEQDIVYRDMPQAGEASPPRKPAPDDHHWQREIKPDPALLLRYSALTFNAHRIHYDRDYAMKIERYPGLVVHGPLVATLLLDLLYRCVPAATVRQFSFRAVAPLFDIDAFYVCGAVDARSPQTIKLWAKDASGMLAMEAEAQIE
jgi:3-methylfumaryl-CoA hydratase